MRGVCEKILLVDDDPAIRRLLRHLLAPQYSVAEAVTGEQALAILADFRPNLVMLDIMMPGIDGYETCRRLRSETAGYGLQVVMVSAKSSHEEQLRAYAAGADDYITKPFDPLVLLSRVRLHFRLRGALEAVATRERARADAPNLTTADSSARGPTQGRADDVTVLALTKVAKLRDTETGEHLARIRSYAQILAEALSQEGPYAAQIDEHFLDDLYRASVLHDIGKVGIADAILLKPAPLSDEEFESMKRHTTIGADILDTVAAGAPETAFLRMAAEVARFHHERFDGRGYPLGLRGTEIPLAARIVALADAYDTITSLRPYKAPKAATTAKRNIEADAGSHFDAAIVAAFRRRFSAFQRVQDQVRDSIDWSPGAMPWCPVTIAAAAPKFA
jgi:putative two-component system response regulator